MMSSNSDNNAGSSEAREYNALARQISEVSVYETDDEPEEVGHHSHNYMPGPLLPLKEQLERDKEDESLRRWKMQLLGSLDHEHIEDKMEPEVVFISLGILTCNNRELCLSLSPDKCSEGLFFTLKEGSKYSLKFTFSVHHNIVSGLVCINDVWKGGAQVDQTRYMLGTFAPQQEPYTHVLEEETTPSGALARGTYCAKTKFLDDDGKIHFEFGYSFEIKKDW